MEIIELRQGDILIFQLKGRLDAKTSPPFESMMTAAIEDGQKI